MKISTLRIENFRVFKDQTVDIGDFACLVGANGAGKSTVLTALNVLFRNNDGTSLDLQCLSKEDFHCQKTDDPIRITATFTDLSDEAKQDLKAYVRQDQLVISAVAVWDLHSGNAVVKQQGQRLVISAFAEYFRADKAGQSAADLKKIYARLRKDHEDLPRVTSKPDMYSALREFEENNPKLCELEPSEDQFYGFSKGANILRKHIQWVFVPAVKDASDEAEETKQSVLGQLLARTVRSKVSFSDEIEAIRGEAFEKYSELLKSQQGVLNELSNSLGEKIKLWAHPDADLTVVWNDANKKAVVIAEPSAAMKFTEGPFEGEVARFGHGLQRSYLLALLQILAESDDETQPTLLLGVEEPELFQHPPQARHLSRVLVELASGNAQVITCTHSPIFIPGDRLLDVRVVRRSKETQEACISACDSQALSLRIGESRSKKPTNEMVTKTRIHQCLNPMIREMFFAPSIILVEGIEDHAYITSWLELTGRHTEFHRLGGHIVPANGKGFMIEPLAILRELSIPVFIIFDSDSKEERPEAQQKHRNDNTALLKLCDLPDEDPMPTECLKKDSLTMWTDDIGSRVSCSVGEDQWKAAQERARAKNGIQVRGMKKNPMFIGLSLQELYEAGNTCEVLDELCDRIIVFLGSVK